MFKRIEQNIPGMVLLTDLKKAFDSVEWPFILDDPSPIVMVVKRNKPVVKPGVISRQI